MRGHGHFVLYLPLLFDQAPRGAHGHSFDFGHDGERVFGVARAHALSASAPEKAHPQSLSSPPLSNEEGADFHGFVIDVSHISNIIEI